MSTQSTRLIPERRALIAGAIAVLILAYSAMISQTLLLGGIAAGSVVLIERATRPETDAASLWMPVAAVVIAIVVGYGLLSNQFLLGVLVEAVVFFIAWTTQPD